MLVAKRGSPPHATMMHIRWVPLGGQVGRKAGKSTVRPRFPLECMSFSGWPKDRVKHPGLGQRFFTPGQLSVEFVNVGGWLTYGDLALGSSAQFLAVTEHRLIPSRARSVSHQLRKVGHQSVWSPACQDQVAGRHAGVGVSLGGAPLSLPFFITTQFKEFFRLGRALRNTLPPGRGGVVHLSVVYGDQGRRMLINFFFLMSFCRLFWLKAQVVCICQPLLIAGDSNADPAVNPCLG